LRVCVDYFEYSCIEERQHEWFDQQRPYSGVVTVNRVALLPQYAVDDLQERVAELYQNGNEEIAYERLWSGSAYSPEDAKAAREAKRRFAA
jgi:hypothetical protein